MTSRPPPAHPTEPHGGMLLTPTPPKQTSPVAGENGPGGKPWGGDIPKGRCVSPLRGLCAVAAIAVALKLFCVRLCFPPCLLLLGPEQGYIPPGFWCPLRMHVAVSGLGAHDPGESQLICWASLGDCCSVAKPSPTLCNPRDCSPPGSSVRGISQARILEWLPFPSPGGLPGPGIEPRSPALAGGFFPTELAGKPSPAVVVLD